MSLKKLDVMLSYFCLDRTVWLHVSHGAFHYAAYIVSALAENARPGHRPAEEVFDKGPEYSSSKLL